MYAASRVRTIRIKTMRIALFIIGALAAGYLIIKGFKQMLAESRQQEEQPKKRLPHDNE